MRSWPYMPGVSAAGHVTSGGFWHPGGGDRCVKCEAPRVADRSTSVRRVVPAVDVLEVAEIVTDTDPLEAK